MRIQTVHIQDFRSVEDSTEFTVADVTCLVGKNESGKTAILRALEKLNAADEGQANFLALDYPRRKYRPDRPLPNDPPAIRTEWHLDDDDVSAINEALGTDCTRGRSVTVSKGYDNELRVSAVALDEPALVGHFRAEAQLAAEEAEPLDGVTTVDGMRDKLRSLESMTDRQNQLAQRLDQMFPAGDSQEPVRRVILARLPETVYFGEYEKLPGQVSLTEYLAKKKQKQLKKPDRLFEALLALAGTTPEHVEAIPDFANLNAALRSISNRLSEEVFEYWSQNRHLDVDLDFREALSGDPPPFNAGKVFRTLIHNRRHRADTNFDDRSAGFVWFFSFLVWLEHLENVYGDRLLVLLDEPGLSLHAKAQSDLLRYFRDKLQPRFQVVYSTHSPFMIDADHLEKVRIVEDVVTSQDEILGTRVSADLMSGDPDTVSPLQRALSYDLSQTLFIGRHTLLLEGLSDVIYLQFFSRELEARGKSRLDPRWTPVQVGGVDRMQGFISLYDANDLHLAAVVDVDSKKTQKLQNLAGVLRPQHLLRVTEFLDNQTEGDIEDLLGRTLYRSLVHQAYGLRPGNFLPDAKPLGAPDRVLSEVTTHFATVPPHVPEFSHLTPAEYLRDHESEVRQMPGFAEAVDRFEKLIFRLNSLMPADGSAAAGSL